MSCLRQSSGNGAAIMPARSTPSSAITLSTVLSELQSNHGVGCKPKLEQPRSNIGDGAVGFGVSQPA